MRQASARSDAPDSISVNPIGIWTASRRESIERSTSAHSSHSPAPFNRLTFAASAISSDLSVNGANSVCLSAESPTPHLLWNQASVCTRTICGVRIRPVCSDGSPVKTVFISAEVSTAERRMGSVCKPLKARLQSSGDTAIPLSPAALYPHAGMLPRLARVLLVSPGIR